MIQPERVRPLNAKPVRPKVHRLWGDYLVPLKTTAVKKDSLGLKFDSLPAADPGALLAAPPAAKSVSPRT